jgi:hypothetical protein|tara:strand:- start:274 stop:462 length:189 start_codon:yes stop_codon:yes gene_type:complete
MKISPIPHMAKLRIKIPKSTFMKIDVTFDLMNCNISNTVPVKDGKTSNLKTVDFATSYVLTS